MRGVLASIPMALCAAAMLLLYIFIDKNVIGFLSHFFDVRHIPGFGILLLLVFLFLIGVIASSFVGRHMLGLIEFISNCIPGIRQVYSLSKQAGEALANTQDTVVFKKAVWVNYPTEGVWTVALAMGRIKDRNSGNDWLEVYLPMAHPYIGAIFLVQEKDVVDPGWKIEDGLKMIASLGIIAPRNA